MASMTPCKNWMRAGRLTVEYMEGVATFLKYVKQNSNGEDWHSCPCTKCCNIRGKMTLETISEHLVFNGIDQTYTTWFLHGEQRLETGASTSVDNCNEDVLPRMVDLVNDAFSHFQPIELDACMDEVNNEDDIEPHDDLGDEARYRKLMEDAKQPLYPSCKPEHTKLSVTVELLSMKARFRWSDNSFTELLNLLKKILPNENSLPDSTYNAKRLISSLGMNYETIHACPNDCILYWKDHADKECCPKCGASRWKFKSVVRSTAPRVPCKVLRYFPLTPRLKRLYTIPEIAENMIWHSKSAQDDICMRHPVDSSMWKIVDEKYADFATEPRNVRLGLATDGFNPFGNMSNSYSCWPVMIVTYNLPPHLCMRKEFTMLTLLIPGKKGPGHDIDVYLQPLIAELLELWEGSVIYDSHSKNMFTMRAILLWAIHDFPAYGHLSGCRTGGKYACPICSEETESVWLEHGKKFAYMGHRRFLPSGHDFRTDRTRFNGKEEKRKAPRRMKGSDVLRKMNNIETIFGKQVRKTKKKSNNDPNNITAWTKRSILFDLPYWEHLPIRHNLDVMHVEKNVTENLIATIMDTKDKTKDGLQARQDLQAMKIRKSMWPEERNGRLFLPKAPFTLSTSERNMFCLTLSNLKVPRGYCANWTHRVNLEDCQLKALKSHDYHIVMQQLLPVLLMHSFLGKKKTLRTAICEMSRFFNVICSKVINREELQNMKNKIVETLCVFEKYFPPSFFVPMTHLVVHLAEEAQLCGPVRYRWMYPFERMMRTYKKYVTNQTYPEGCIAERYILEESMMYCMDYMPDKMLGSHKRVKKIFYDEGDDNANNFQIDKKGKSYLLTNVQYQQARRWVLQHHVENAQWLGKYNEYIHSQTRKGQNRRGNPSLQKEVNYNAWLREQLENEEMSQFKRIATGPSYDATSYSTYSVNGYVFCTSDSEKNLTTQNSGVSMKALTMFRASARDKNLVEQEATYYGIIRQILELNYFTFKITLFYCDWVHIEDTSNGCYVDPETNLIFVNLGRFRRNIKEEDEPFIHASQAAQVFYCEDPTRDDWHVVLDVPKRLTKDAYAFEDPLVFEARLTAGSSSPSLIDDPYDPTSEDIQEGSYVEIVECNPRIQKRKRN